MNTAVLSRLAEAMGIRPQWRGIDGSQHTVMPDTQRALLAAMGVPAGTDADADAALRDVQAAAASRLLPEEQVVEAELPCRVELRRTLPWQLHLEHGGVLTGSATDTVTMVPPIGVHRLQAGGQECLVVAAPARAPTPVRRLWGVTAAIYGLRSPRNLGLGDYRDLAVAAANLAPTGANFVGINPVHARGAACDTISPYSPSCRTAYETRHIALHDVPGFADSAHVQRCLDDASDRLATARTADQVDYAAHDTIHQSALQTLFDAFQRTPGPASDEFAAWRRQRDADLEPFAVFEAISQRHGPDWRTWPADLRAAQTIAVQSFATDAAPAVTYHAWLQWLADRQLAGAQQTAKSAGMALGLYLDIAVGVRSGGADTWAAPACFAASVSLGAPPDAFSPHGQTWNIAPFNPIGLRGADYAPFIAMLRAAMTNAGLIRIDHILGASRSFWIPAGGAPGAYVSYPVETLLALIRIEAHRAGCMVVGEDLGSVPDGLRQRLADTGLFGCTVMQFEHGDGGFRHPSAYRPATLASFGTHDTPTIRGWWSGHDIDLRRDLGFYDAHAHERAQQSRQHQRQQLTTVLRDAGLPPTDEGAPVSPVHTLLARSASQLVAVQLDDALDVVDQQNLPGTVDEYPNWRRRYPVNTGTFSANTHLADFARAFQAAQTAHTAADDQGDRRCQ